MTIYTDLAEKICKGMPDGDVRTWQRLARTPDDRVFELMAGADMIRRHSFGTGIHLCAINNAKSGRCSEDCRFCAQAGAYATGAGTYGLKSEGDLARSLAAMAETPVHRYSMVTSGRGLGPDGVKRIAGVLSGGSSFPQQYCASLGILDADALGILREAGVTRYHHNLETSRSHFTKICTTHTYEERTATVSAAKQAGLSVCSGGIFGMGETMDQVIELALDLKALDVDAVPVNFLTPIEGTPLEGQPQRSPLDCLKIISLLRYILPNKEIIVCGGRLDNLKELHPLVFFAGASGIMTGSYLTTDGRQMAEDLEMIRRLGLAVRRPGSRSARP